MADAFIKIYKKMLKWEWYDDPNTKILFLHCLLRANWEKTKWHGIDLEPGQFVTSLANLATETCLSVRQVRTALEHLESTGEVTSKSQSKYRVITINKWTDYQGSDKQSDKQATSKRQGSDKQATTVKEYKEVKEEKNNKHIYGEYKHIYLTDAERDRLFNDYGEMETIEAIKFLDEYKQRKGYKCKDDNLTLRKWVFDAVKEEKSGKRSRGNGQQEPISLAEKWGLGNDA